MNKIIKEHIALLDRLIDLNDDLLFETDENDGIKPCDIMQIRAEIKAIKMRMSALEAQMAA